MKTNPQILAIILLFSTSLLLLSACKPKDASVQNKKAQWITQAYSKIRTESRIQSVAWWNESWEGNRADVLMKINSSDSSLVAFNKQIADAHFVSQLKIDSGKIVPTTGKCYNSAFLGIDMQVSSTQESENAIDEYENISNKKLALLSCTSTWYDTRGGIHFPTKAINLIYNSGHIPMMYIEPWHAYDYDIKEADPKYNMQRIINGDWDSDLRQFALDIKASGIPIMATFGHEVNGEWFPWNGTWNGGATKDQFGDPNKADGPERFVAAYKHLIDIFRNNNVENITWVMGLSFNTQPEEDWNKMAAYYPGDDYIDWIGLSIYGPLNSKDENQYSFEFLWNYIQAELAAMNSTKPIIILEMGVGEH